MVRSLDAWRALERATALSTLIRQRHLTPSCGGHDPTAERTVGPARMIVESLTPRPGIREQHRPKATEQSRIAETSTLTGHSRYSAESFRRGRAIVDTSPEEHTPEQFVFHNELMVERGKHVQNDEAGQDRRNIAVCYKARINLEGRW